MLEWGELALRVPLVWGTHFGASRFRMSRVSGCATKEVEGGICRRGYRK